MKIIDAVWEKRNLGVTTQEITVEQNDSAEDLSRAIANLDSQYNVIKIPAGMMECISLAEDDGFRFAEAQIKMSGIVKQVLPIAQNDLLRYKNYSVKTENSSEMFDFVADKIREGIFGTDRIALDPEFSKDIANKRYANWLLDLKENPDSHLQIMQKGSDIVGFNLNKKNGNQMDGLIGGLCKEFQNSALGIFWAASIFRNIAEYSPETTVWNASVSSNNYSIIKLWLHFGMNVSDISYVLVRHR